MHACFGLKFLKISFEFSTIRSKNDHLIIALLTINHSWKIQSMYRTRLNKNKTIFFFNPIYPVMFIFNFSIKYARFFLVYSVSILFFFNIVCYVWRRNVFAFISNLCNCISIFFSLFLTPCITVLSFLRLCYKWKVVAVYFFYFLDSGFHVHNMKFIFKNGYLKKQHSSYSLCRWNGNGWALIFSYVFSCEIVCSHKGICLHLSGNI